nr:MAG TPA_asm: hypothetical protein [Caudoviricetes sp.]
MIFVTKIKYRNNIKYFSYYLLSVSIILKRKK